MKKLIYAVLGIILLAAIAILIFFNLPGASTKNKDAAFNISPQEILSSFQQDEKTANKKYLGKVVSIKGKVKSIEKDKKESTVIMLDTGDSMANILCTMENEPNNITIGQELTIKGMCNGYLMDVVLNRCNIVR